MLIKGYSIAADSRTRIHCAAESIGAVPVGDGFGIYDKTIRNSQQFNWITRPCLSVFGIIRKGEKGTSLGFRSGRRSLTEPVVIPYPEIGVEQLHRSG